MGIRYHPHPGLPQVGTGHDRLGHESVGRRMAALGWAGGDFLLAEATFELHTC